MPKVRPAIIRRGLSSLKTTKNRTGCSDAARFSGARLAVTVLALSTAINPLSHQRLFRAIAARFDQRRFQPVEARWLELLVELLELRDADVRSWTLVVGYFVYVV